MTDHQTKTVERPKLKIKVASDEYIPHYASNGASGADLKACIDTPLIIEPFQTVLVPTGIFLEIPHGWEAQVRPRSGLALKHGITVLNTPGTIDSDYRGEIMVTMYLFGADAAYEIKHGDRIAQLVIIKLAEVSLEEVPELSDTERGAGGHGSTGMR